VANPHAANPFLDASELEIIGPDTARIKISSGFHYFAEPARRMRNAAGQVIELWLGGDRLLPQADRASEIER
jgi:hypothetical protein